MKTANDLQSMLRAIDRKSYPAYKSLKGFYQFERYLLSIDHVQGDPFASPSHVSILIPLKTTGFPDEYLKNDLTRTALCDYLLRQFSEGLRPFAFRAKGSGKSGLISVTSCGPEVLTRSDCRIYPSENTSDGSLVIRFRVGFPANGRSINSGELEKIFFEFLPVCIKKSCFYQSLNADSLRRWIYLAEDQDCIRTLLRKKHLTAFVADGSVLPRESGVSSKPMKQAVPFTSPESLRVSLSLPHKGQITGMGIPEGITLITGGGYHGKSTLLDALDHGIYCHIPGDGREYVITDPSALKLRSEDGRFIKDVDISLFINNLPGRKNTRCFSTEDASGSTSQAAGIVEGMEAGARVFLMDEDTSAANFMVRDAFMQKVVSQDKEPITPFFLRAEDLYRKAGISTILVAGSSGAFFHIADTVIQMDSYRAFDITEKAKALCFSFPLPETAAHAFEMPEFHRVMTKDPVGPARKRDYRSGAYKNEEASLKVKVHSLSTFSLGKQEIDLRYLEQLIDQEQTASLGYLLKYAAEHLIDGRKTLSEVVTILDQKLKEKGTDFFSEGGYIPGGYAIPRIQEIYSCFNRYRRA